MNPPTILALDFDGVLCDGMIEYFQSSWRAYCQIWTLDRVTPPPGLAERFYQCRPAIETGWEMPVLIRALEQGIPESKILSDWGAIAQQIVVEERLVPASIAVTLDHLRDYWIATDLEGWLAQHRFYPGIIEHLRRLLASRTGLKIITTKEGRFVHQLLQQQGITLAEEQVWGKELQRSKSQSLRQLLQSQQPPPEIWFVEDRLKTLQSVCQQPDLHSVQLFLASWGYNTGLERDQAAQSSQIRLLSLSQFSQDFSSWI